MISVSFKKSISCPPYSTPSARSLYTNNKKHLQAVCTFFGAGLFFLISLCCTELALAGDVTLGWDPNSEPDLEGYGVYFRKGAPGPPYNLFGYITADDLRNHRKPVFTVDGLEKGARYYFAITAYDASGHESSFSNSVCAEIGDVIAPCSSSGGGGGGGGTGGGNSYASSGSGGGGGCFIETVAADAGCWNMGPAGLTILGCMLAGMKYVGKRRDWRFRSFFCCRRF
jgi:hypothetical protein